MVGRTERKKGWEDEGLDDIKMTLHFAEEPPSSLSCGDGSNHTIRPSHVVEMQKNLVTKHQHRSRGDDLHLPESLAGGKENSKWILALFFYLPV